jgi:hypothetical protein
MINAKRVADLITGFRAFLALFLAWLGWARGMAGLPLAIWIMLSDWTGDSLDGTLARHSRKHYHTWLGDHDLLVDMAVATGLLLYMAAAGFVDPLLAGAYILSWGLVFTYLGIPRSLGMLVQAPIYGWFIWIAVHQTPVGWLLVIWIIAAMIVTWPRFPQEVIPGFLTGLRELDRRYRHVRN